MEFHISEEQRRLQDRARHLAKDNEVWGVARFADAAKRQALEDAGITTRSVDVGAGDFSELPTDFIRYGWHSFDPETGPRVIMRRSTKLAVA